jgi:hypothetical protein
MLWWSEIMYSDTDIRDEFKVTCLMAGQPRRYADSEYKYELKDLADLPRTKDEVLVWCRKHLRNYPDTKSFLSAYLQKFEQRSDGIYVYHVISPYCD